MSTHCLLTIHTLSTIYTVSITHPLHTYTLCLHSEFHFCCYADKLCYLLGNVLTVKHSYKYHWKVRGKLAHFVCIVLLLARMLPCEVAILIIVIMFFVLFYY